MNYLPSVCLVFLILLAFIFKMNIAMSIPVSKHGRVNERVSRALFRQLIEGILSISSTFC